MKFLYVVSVFAILQNRLITEIVSLTPHLQDYLDDLYDFIPNIEGKCSELVSVQESRKVPYIETYREKTWGLFYKTRTRWNFRLEFNPSWRKQYTCCTGYELTEDLTCEPKCHQKCGNGTCVKPNVCTCNPGYEETHSDPVCVPQCTHICVHGKCTAPEVCTCDYGYSLNKDGHTCEPVCNSGCDSGSYCSKPNHCACLNGYTDLFIPTDEGILHKCRAICKNLCIHGKCIAPDTCACDTGYELDPENIFICKPKCEHGCLYGTCVRPNQCICDRGYSLENPSKPKCEPICSVPCVMGTCVAPESCSCFEGYGLFENSTYNCQPVCEKACFNGNCTAPGVCTCNKGFRLSGDESMKHVCEPYCEISCEPFGTCTAPNVCTCFEGYRLANKTQVKKIDMQNFADNSVCEPICDTECINGFCSAPNRCSCNIGYQPSDKFANICEPICGYCINGVCSAPEICTCNKGYRPSNVCKDMRFLKTIEPCSTPNRSTTHCEPICNPSCENSICVKPGVCDCYSGYSKSTHSINVCDPICHQGCNENEICRAPHLCDCKDNYRTVYDKKDVSLRKCEPICTVDCGNGTCTAPNVCSCFDGYRNVETGRCEPFCSTCNNGTCVAPEVCECDDGFVLEESKKIKPGIWSLGYILENGPGNGSRCVPRCENCDNGDCVAPDECRCRAGFVKINGTCEHACKDDCGTHGECIEEDGICECNYGWTGRNCDRPTLCISILNGDDNRTESFNVIEEQNNTIEHVLINNPVCPECINKINNETLCFKMHINDTEKETQIGCLMNKGYRALNDTNDKETCVPVCTNGCINGTCVEPEVCSCNEGYLMDSDGFTCRPACDEECERNYGYCYEPHVCSCLPGYKKIDNNSSSCEPVCDRACINGYCAAPNVCKCIDSYEIKQSDRFTCTPKCETCRSGACLASNVCICKMGYAPKLISCEPRKMGTCNAPEGCSCNDDYELRNGSSKYVCEPICENCNNGTCNAPGVCVCDEGFVYDNQTRVCKPHCTIPCGPNEKCTSPNTCTCSQGYRFNTKLSQELLSTTGSQINGENKKPQSQCVPVCDFECINGTCTAPNVCTCNEDYEPSWLKLHKMSSQLEYSPTRICVPRGKSRCQPPCRNNQICIAALIGRITIFICDCNDGYTRDPNGHCVPHCIQKCSNGTCTEPNRCTCNAGFALKNENLCEPICERGCQNGDCVGPNHCICRDSFVPNTGSFGAECISVCDSLNCSDHSACILEDDEYRCKCHYGWTGMDCDEPTICVIKMDFNHSDVNKITIRNDTNNSVIIAYENAPYCYHCDSSLNKESLCYLIHSDKNDTTPIIGCLFSTDLPCYLASHYNASINAAKIIWIFVTIVISITTILIAYLVYRRREKKKIDTAGMPTNLFLRESFVTESLLPDSVFEF
ncbi:fibrillin-2-like [Nylanderia fulva]|uniref:fibrillin-2-like n=1 Tax=Nylanderia fulva TaxID=613905 RepID=UPI0010FB8FC2|nr:fibrillin-2-like [Nylanderia fulva]